MKTKLSIVKNEGLEKAVAILNEYQELKEVINAANKRANELKALIKNDYKPGEYGNLILTIEERQVKEYVVSARVDQIIKVTNK